MQITQDRIEQASYGGQKWWLVHGTMTDDEGINHEWCHRLPLTTLEQRAAEYGIDHADIETLLDVVVWEPYLHHLNDGVDHNHPKFLWKADTIDEAREHYLQRIKKVKKLLAHPDQHDHNANLDPIRQNHGIDPEMVALRAEHFGLQRDGWRKHQAAKVGREDVGDKERLRNQIAEHRRRLGKAETDPEPETQ